MCSDRPRIQNTLESEVQATPIHSHKGDPDKPSALRPSSTLQARSKKAHSSSSTASDGRWCLLECCLQPHADEKTASPPPHPWQEWLLLGAGLTPLSFSRQRRMTSPQNSSLHPGWVWPREQGPSSTVAPWFPSYRQGHYFVHF